ncbi:hypothetical protein C8Q70DRAFT_51320 [Cubamyces menziesii]|nr:hypothetical protein C8Q70DRAFT_51320 [Cubamyces menziesii]
MRPSLPSSGLVITALVTSGRVAASNVSLPQSMCYSATRERLMAWSFDASLPGGPRIDDQPPRIPEACGCLCGIPWLSPVPAACPLVCDSPEFI